MFSLKHFLMPHEGNYRSDFLSGLTVALALIPEAVAFALLAGLDPTVGLYAAFIMCLVCALLGGRPGMISGATGSMAVVMISIMLMFPGNPALGMAHLFVTILITGIFQIIFGVFRCGKFIRMMPKSVMVGFVNGLAIVIFMAQLQEFKYLPPGASSKVWLQGIDVIVMVGLVLVAMIITHFLPKLTKAFPAALLAIIVVTGIVYLCPLPAQHVLTVGDMIGTGASSVHHGFQLPAFGLLNWHSMTIILPYGFILAVIGLSESLMTLSLIDERTNTQGHPNRECVAQGIGNIICSFFSSMGGCAMIGQSMINITSGARGRLSGITAACFLFLFIALALPLIKLIPLAALVGVMFMVVIETFEWATFKFIGKVPKHDILIIVVVTLITVWTDLAIAIFVGVILASLVFAWESAKNIRIEKKTDKKGQCIYYVYGPLFFSSTVTFRSKVHPEIDPDDVIFDFQHSRVCDHSALDVIAQIAEQYRVLGKSLHLRHLSSDCRQRLGKASGLVEVNLMEDPNYKVATD